MPRTTPRVVSVRTPRRSEDDVVIVAQGDGSRSGGDRVVEQLPLLADDVHDDPPCDQLAS
jgi:hypothetical protein